MLGVVLIGFFFALLIGLAFPLSGILFCCPAKDVLVICTFGVVLLLVTIVGHEVVAGVSVVVATTACNLYISFYMFSLNPSACLIWHTDFS